VTLYPESFVNQLDARCSITGSKLFFTCNPDSPNHYIKQNYLDKLIDGYHKNIAVYSFLMEDNPALSRDYVDHLKTLYTGVFYQRFIMGLWVLAEGIIYPNFDVNTHVISQTQLPTRFDSYYVACDYGITNPHVYLLIGQKREGAVIKSYVIKEYYNDDKSGNKTDVTLYNDYMKFVQGYHIQSIIIDPSAASLINYFKSRMLYPKPANNDVLEGISNVSIKLTNQELYITQETCKKLIAEFNTYIWDCDKSKLGLDVPLKENDHCLTGDTLVDTVDGQIPIRDLVGKEGLVHCYDEVNQKATISKFKDVRLTRKKAQIYVVELEDGRTIKATGDHLILTKRGWVELLNLTCEDEIIDIGGV
jgi:PBSX family phage terminase large subunit